MCAPTAPTAAAKSEMTAARRTPSSSERTAACVPTASATAPPTAAAGGATALSSTGSTGGSEGRTSCGGVRYWPQAALARRRAQPLAARGPRATRGVVGTRLALAGRLGALGGGGGCASADNHLPVPRVEVARGGHARRVRARHRHRRVAAQAHGGLAGRLGHLAGGHKRLDADLAARKPARRAPKVLRQLHVQRGRQLRGLARRLALGLARRFRAQLLSEGLQSLLASSPASCRVVLLSPRILARVVLHKSPFPDIEALLLRAALGVRRGGAPDRRAPR